MITHSLSDLDALATEEDRAKAAAGSWTAPPSPSWPASCWELARATRSRRSLDLSAPGRVLVGPESDQAPRHADRW